MSQELITGGITTETVLKVNGQKINDFKAYGTKIDGVLFLVDEKYIMKHCYVEQLENYVKWLRKETIKIHTNES